jgi:hypothetical protein
VLLLLGKNKQMFKVRLRQGSKDETTKHTPGSKPLSHFIGPRKQY